tara:strand:+ start:171 stop:566 length:396 start_codon:yes stop_codon:yes gene_type:complete
LESLRARYEKLVECQHQIWAGELEWDQLIGIDNKAKQPRIVITSVVDAATADTVEFSLDDNTPGVSRQIMQAPDVAPTAMFFMCNPKTHHGSDRWHRDVGGPEPGAAARAAGGRAGEHSTLRAVQYSAVRR